MNLDALVEQLMTGQLSMTLESVGKYIYEHIFAELAANKEALWQILGIALLGAVFTNFSAAFAQNYVAKTGIYITYVLLFSLFLTAFMTAYTVAEMVLVSLLDFCKMLLPVFASAVVLASGTVTASGVYAVMTVAIAAVDWLVCKVVLKVIQIYLVLSLADTISNEVNLSRFTGFIRTIIRWTLKTLLGVTLGINAIQSLILPAFDSLKNSTLMKVISVVPGIGNALGAAAQTALGSGVLLKNAVGVGGLILIIVLSAVPLIKLLILTLMYKLTEGLVATVCDDGITACVHVAADSILLLFMAVGTAVLLFVLSLAVIASASNFG